MEKAGWRQKVRLPGVIFIVCAVAAFAFPLRSQAPQTSSDLVQATVTAIVPAGATLPALTREDIIVRQDKQPRPVVAWVPAQDSKARLQLAILVDDSLDASLGLQHNDLSEFLRSLPKNSLVEIAYASNGAARIAQSFTTEHEAAIRALRVPLGLAAYSGIYFSLADLIKKWPAGEGRREVLLISHGIDLTYGIAGSRPSGNLALEEAIRAAQRNNITVYSIFASGTGLLPRNEYLVLNGQSCLAELTLETGGDSFTQGFATPLSFGPFLQEMEKMLEQQYLLTFKAELPKQAGYHDLRVTTEMSRVELLAPAQVYLPAAK
jgi:VWFA-related protein